MQVGLKTSSPLASAPAPAGRGNIDAPQTVGRVHLPDAEFTRHSFPESALLSRRPMRYNVQLNQQLTAVQQADSYLAKTETQLLQLRQTSGRSGDASVQAAALQKHLSRRMQLSGGTIDRHLNASLEKKNAVNFTLPGSEKLVQFPAGETLIFALGGTRREMAAVALPEEATPRQTLTKLNVGLGRLGIHASQTDSGQLLFSVDESRWEQVKQHFSVRGEGKLYPADAFTLLAPQAESANSDEMMALSARREREGQMKLQDTLNHITSQRSKLRQQQDRVSARINDMATVYSSQQALHASRRLGEGLARSADSFSQLSQALGAQANVRLATVKNLLG
ncbi:hypothetical protein IM311_09570 [Enterobacter cloacae complex sp. P40RS]|uniref:Flagellar hook-associated protein n=1 Tax=Enterobacter pasteurii TaxID=3029761 RepID=A0ABR9Q653_9ENTR|nr:MULTISPECIES: hypothetical protein [Enterobacter cloacae complex]MBE4854319.1 hypothetical protein [Enterobacter pasteurii]MBE4864055.1 hypothetical protein [Enterobacter cloacae complex sp. P40C2]MBE4876231.1 hypothetical protein [Enterobacter cloacae complex sp. P40C]